MLNPLIHLELQSKIQPQKNALCDVSYSITYRQLFILVKQVAKKLASLGVKPGQVIVTCLPTKLDWIFTNALFHEACVACSNHDSRACDLEMEFDFVIATKKLENIPEEKMIIIDASWIQEAQKEQTLPAFKSYSSQEALCRLVLTSGTTGFSKAAAFNVKTVLERATALNSYWIRSGENINMMSLATVGGFFTALNTMITGNTFYCVYSAQDVIKLVKQFSLNTVIGSPIQLAIFLKEAKPEKELLSSIKEFVASGGVLPAHLVTELRETFNADIFNVYGATEVGGVCVNLVQEKHHSSHGGFVLPHVEIEIVDNLNIPLSPGLEGFIRIKTARMVQGYYKDSEATSRSFKDGWFYSGDRGCLLNGGFLVLTGRESEMINRGGVKINPASIDQFLLSYPGIKDAAAFGLENKIGIQDVAAAIVVAENFNLKKLQIDLSKKFGQAASPSVFFNVNQIPRNQMGKVMRREMGKKFASVIKEEASQREVSQN